MKNAEKLVDLVGEALGIDTGAVSERCFGDAVEAAKKAHTAENLVDEVTFCLGRDPGDIDSDRFDEIVALVEKSQ